mmetsp:Transcript_8509/g.22403  ORF Transcript_8509/g.22403 Transcript_8509/m.22403 type:complete len:273 (-) Transcript_8509:222-1040(-)
MSTGRFCSSGASAKCTSMSCAPARNASTTSVPYCSDSGMSPTAEHTEKRPPTQSQNPNALLGSIPNCSTAERFVLTATMCLRTASSPSASAIHLRIVRALSIVSAVVKVFETTTTSVASGESPSVARATSTGSTLARKRSRRPAAASLAAASQRSASYTNSGPRYEPPIPIATTSVSGLPVAPTNDPPRTAAENSAILARTARTCSTTFSPSTMIRAAPCFGARNAVCSTARPSVVLIFSPASIARILSVRCVACASATSLRMVSTVARCRE